MKTPDPASETPRRPPAPPPAEPGPRRAEEHEEAELRYISLPRRRARGHGARNLAWGVALLILAAGLLGWGLYLAGPGAAFTFAVSLATAATLYVAARARLLRQRNGNFLAGAIVCVMAVGCVLIQEGWRRLVEARDSQTSSSTAAAQNGDPSAAAPTSAKNELPALIEAFRPSRAELEGGETAEILALTKVTYEGRTWLLRPGDIFPVNSVTREQVKLGVLTDEIAIPATLVKVHPPEPAPEPPPRTASAKAPPGREPAGKGAPAPPPPENGQLSPEELQRAIGQSNAEAMRRYPALAIEDSPENLSFRAAVQELKVSGHRNILQEPDWPVWLAEQLAQREGWADASGKRKETRPFTPPAGDPLAPGATSEPDATPPREPSANDAVEDLPPLPPRKSRPPIDQP